MSALFAESMVRISSLVGSYTRCHSGLPYIDRSAASVSGIRFGRYRSSRLIHALTGSGLARFRLAGFLVTGFLALITRASH